MPPPRTTAQKIQDRLAQRQEQRAVNAGVAADPTEQAIKQQKELAKQQAQVAREVARQQARDRAELDRLEAQTRQRIANDNRKERERIEREGLKQIADYHKQQQEQERKDAQERKRYNDAYNAELASGISRIGAIATVAMNSVVNFGNSIAGFVAKINPAAVQRFTMAVDNWKSAIGGVLTPVLERVTIVTQIMGNAIASLSPQAKNLIAGLTGGGGLAAVFAGVAFAVKVLLTSLGPIPLIIGFVVSSFAGVAATMSSGQAIADKFSLVLKTFGQIIEIIATVTLPIINAALETVIPLLVSFAQVLGEVAMVAKDFIESIGLGTAETYDPNRKRATAVKQAQFSDLSSFANRAYATAYGGATVDIPSQQLSVQQQILAEMKKRNGIGADGKTDFERGRGIISDRLYGAPGADGKTDTRRGFDTIRDKPVESSFEIGKWLFDKMNPRLGKARELMRSVLE